MKPRHFYKLYEKKNGRFHLTASSQSLAEIRGEYTLCVRSAFVVEVRNGVHRKLFGRQDVFCKCGHPSWEHGPKNDPNGTWCLHGWGVSPGNVSFYPQIDGEKSCYCYEFIKRKKRKPPGIRVVFRHIPPGK